MTTFPIHLFLTPKISTEENHFQFKTFHTEKSLREFVFEDVKDHSRKISIVFGKVRIDSLFIILSEYLKICLEDGWGCMEIIDGSGSRWGDETNEDEEYDEEDYDSPDSDWEQEWDDETSVQEVLDRSLDEERKTETAQLPTEAAVSTYQNDPVYIALHQTYRDIVDDISNKMTTSDDYRRAIDGSPFHLSAVRVILAGLGYQTELERGSILYIYTYRRQ